MRIGLTNSVLPVAVVVALAGRAFAQAEPAPETYVPPAQRNQPESGPSEGGKLRLDPDQPRWHIFVAPRLVLPMGPMPNGLPSVGLGGGVQVHRALVPLGRVLRFGIGFDFAYDRIFGSSDPNPNNVSHATFAAVLVLDALVGPDERLRPFVAIGGGLSVGSFQFTAGTSMSAPNAPSQSLAEALGLVHIAVGLQARVYQGFCLGVHGETNITFSSTTAGVPAVALFQPGFAEVVLDLGFRF
jgi:hypothetical protein